MGNDETPNCVRWCLRNPLFTHAHLVLLDTDGLAQIHIDLFGIGWKIIRNKKKFNQVVSELKFACAITNHYRYSLSDLLSTFFQIVNIKYCFYCCWVDLD